MNEIIRGAGYRSTKLHFSIFAIVVIFVGAILAARWASMAPLYATLVGGVLGITSLQITGNLVQKNIGIKALGITGSEDGEAPRPPPPRFPED